MTRSQRLQRYLTVPRENCGCLRDGWQISPRLCRHIYHALFARVFTRSWNYSYLYSRLFLICARTIPARNDSPNAPRRADARRIMRSYIQPYRFAKRRETIFRYCGEIFYFTECIRAFHLTLKYPVNALCILKGVSDIAKLRNCLANTVAIPKCTS